MELVLDIGCGQNKTPGAIGVDRAEAACPDVVADIEQPLPFADDTFTRVVCSHVVEHIHNLMGLMEEIWRVCRHGAVVEIAAPHFASRMAHDDPTHIRYIGARTFDPFQGHGFYHYYTHARFEIVDRRVTTTGWARAFGGGLLAKYQLGFYEREACYVLRPKAVHVTLRAIKTGAEAQPDDA